ncbi:hypothetical protein ABTH20_20420, partial [Acinetobacter baumannii]
EATACFQRAETAINAATSNADYNNTMANLIPAYLQVGKGTVPSQAAWIRNINTLRARNILVNTLASALTPAQLNQIQTLTTNGITS